MSRRTAIMIATGVWLINVAVYGIVRGTMIWFIFGGAGFFIGRFFPWQR